MWSFFISQYNFIFLSVNINPHRGLNNMARPPKNNKENAENSITEDFANELIKEINKTHNEKIAFNLGSDDAPTHVSRWIPTGSRQLDYIISNRRNGGMPEGRIVEIQGPPGIGKSTLMAQIARSTQRMGGIVVFIDTENATNPDTLANMGVDVARRFVFVQSPCTEEILSIIESTILKARTMTKDVPVTVIWDSVSQSSPKAELEGDYDQNTIGLQARVLSKGMRKIANVIGGQKVLLVLVSQQRQKIGVMFGDPCVTPDTKIKIRRRK
jgi:recombination protein RecA